MHDDATDNGFSRAEFFRAPRRRLTAAERALLPAPIAAAVDFYRVLIIRAAHNPYAALFRITVVRGSRIFWAAAPSEALTLSERAHLAHELVHVWQYQALKRSGIGMLLDRRYRYDLLPGKCFAEFGAEQQAAIVEDQIRLAGGALPRWSTVAHPLERYAALTGGNPVA